ncbi:MAG: energy transducer TonB [Proteobacteria bacterium]|nr:energy transducer TonB [Pseudomonadota bacterium]
MGVYVHDSNWASRRGIAFIAMVLLHILLIWGLKSGFAMKVIDTLAPPIVTEIIEETKDEDTPPPPPPPKMDMPPVEVPPLVVDISVPVESSTTALSNVSDKPQPPPPPPRVVEAPRNIVSAGLRKGASQPDSEEYYPPSSKRLSEQGNVVVKSCLDDKAKITEVTVQEASSFPKLDEAALKYAKALRYAPATENGKPIAGCFAFRVKFQLKD